MTARFRVEFITTAALVGSVAAFGQNTGPSSSQSAYILPTIGGVSTTSILTVGDNIGGYRMVGIPDGLGAFNNDGGGSFTLMMNHELGGTSGAVRAHGQTGAFVSRWNINTDLTVTSGRDHNTSSADAFEYTGGGNWSNAPSGAQRWNRFCSADLAAPTAYYNASTGLGTNARIFMNGEENGSEGRAYAHIVTGAGTNQTYALPHLGKFSWENSVASPYAQNKTVVMGLDDSTTNGGVYMYVGNKTNTGRDIDRAGLTNGNLFGVKVNGLNAESRTAPPAAGTRFSLYNHGDVSATTGAALDSAGAQLNAGQNNVSAFLRPEDGAWDTRPGHESDFYFVTTDRFNTGSTVGRSRLWRMRFDDINNPESGGTIDALLNGTEGQQMFDNMTIDSHGRILLQEDIGGNDQLGKIWLYDIATQGFVQVAQHDPARFGVGAPGFLTNDEESSGIIDAKDQLGDGWFLLDVQAHYGISGELVEGGQLLAMYVDPRIVPEPASFVLLALGGVALLRRR